MKRINLRNGGTLCLDGAQGVANYNGQKITMDGAIALAVNVGTLDADGAFFFQRQLEHIKARSYDVKYAKLKARELFPVSNEGGKGITHITYRTYDSVGAAKYIHAYADDFPRADVSGKETSIPVRPIGSSYGYSLDEIQAAELTGAPLEQRKADACVRAVEEEINNTAFFGNDEVGLVGLFNHPNIPTGAVAGGDWTVKTPSQIIDDINGLFTDIFETTKMVEQGNTLLLPPSKWSYIMSTPRSTTTDTTIGQYIVNNSPYISSLADIIPVNECASTNNPALASDAMVAYDRNPDKLQLEIPVELEMRPPQERNLEFVIPARARFAGLNVYYPLSVAIGTGI